jgi:hypothetical protein
MFSFVNIWCDNQQNKNIVPGADFRILTKSKVQQNSTALIKKYVAISRKLEWGNIVSYI